MELTDAGRTALEPRIGGSGENGTETGGLMDPLRIAQVVPPIERVPPLAYGGTERIVDALCAVLSDRGHQLTVFASGDSEVPGELIPTVRRALRPDGFGGDVSPYMLETIEMVLDRQDDFDVIHSHLETFSPMLVRATKVPVVSTFHGRLDLPGLAPLLVGLGTDHGGRRTVLPPNRLVAISASQASAQPEAAWRVVHNGLDLTDSPFRKTPGDSLCFVGRVDPEKGIIDAIDIAREAGRKLRIAAKVGTLPQQQAYYEKVFKPALDAAGSEVEYLGELSPEERDDLFADSYATLMPGAWPEPFGLVAIESLACGTPIIARRVGGLPEIIREGRDGWFGDDVKHIAFLVDRVETLDRAAIRSSVLDRFSATRMTSAYESLYREVIDAADGAQRTAPAADAPTTERHDASEADDVPEADDSREEATGTSGSLPESVASRR
jgi:glycosyltransferase involved in cell wall biosynthesis